MSTGGDATERAVVLSRQPRRLASVVAVVALATACTGSPAASPTIPLTSAVPSGSPPMIGAPTASPPTTATPNQPTPAPPLATANPPLSPEPLPTPDLLARPQVWFGPLDPSPPNADRPYSGRLDFYNLFSVEAPWERAAQGTHVFKFYGGWLARSVTVDQLEPVVADLKRRGLGIAFEGGPLTPTGQCTGAIEGFAGPAEGSSAAVRILQAGGTLNYVDLEHPYDAVTFSNAPQACRYTPEQTAQDVARYVQAIRSIFPNALFGAVETANNDVNQVARWVEAYRTVMGEDLAYFNFDLDYHDPNWPQEAKAVEDYLHERGIEFGMFYRGDETDATDAEWVARAEERFVAYEAIAGGHPDRAVFQSWHPHPEHLLPESDPTTFTYLVDRYLRTRATLTLEAAPSAAAPTLSGTLEGADGSPLADAAVEIRMMPLDGPGLAYEYTLSGTVPVGAIQADVGYRVNTECNCAGTSEFTLYRVRYTDSAGGSNLVPNGNFAGGWDGWGAWGYEGAWDLKPSDLGSGVALYVATQPGQAAAINSARFAPHGGTPFTVTFLARVSPQSKGSGYFDVVFLDASQELQRVTIPLEAAMVSLGQASTDQSGAYQIQADEPITSRVSIQAWYPGDETYWPAYTEVVLNGV